MEDLHSETKMLRFALFLFSGVGAFIAGFAAYRYWKKTRETRRAETNRLRLEQVKAWYTRTLMEDIFDCCKQSLTRLCLPPTHPSIHPSIHQARYFLRLSKYQLLNSLEIFNFNPYLIYNHSKFSTQNFQLIIFNANTQHFPFQTLFYC